MVDTQRKAPSSKVAQPVPVEFRQIFVEHGWDRVNHLFGKRASVRFFTVVGGDRLRKERVAYQVAAQLAPVGRGNATTLSKRAVV